MFNLNKFKLIFFRANRWELVFCKKKKGLYFNNNYNFLT